MKYFISICMSIVLIFGVVGYVQAPVSAMVFADGYNGSTYEGASVDTMAYDHKTDGEISIKGALPKYHNSGVNRNACANVAGSILLGYYDKNYDELIPNFKAARVIRDKVLFAGQTDAVQKVTDELYVKMKTNTTGDGTTVKDFKSGLESYVEQQDRHISYSSLVSRERLGIQKYKETIDNERPIVLFVSRYTMIDLYDGIKENNKSDTYNFLHYGGDHVLVGYGIREIKYYNKDGSLKDEINLLMVATGYYQDPLAYVIINDTMRIVDGYDVKIY